MRKLSESKATGSRQRVDVVDEFLVVALGAQAQDRATEQVEVDREEVGDGGINEGHNLSNVFGHLKQAQRPLGCVVPHGPPST